MWINPFWAGVFATIGIEMLIVILLSIKWGVDDEDKNN